MKNRKQIIFHPLASLCVVVISILVLKAILYFVSHESLIEATPQPLKLTSSEEFSTFTSVTQNEYNLSVPGKFSVAESSTRKTILTNNTMTCGFLSYQNDETIYGIMDTAKQPDGYGAFHKIYHTSSSDIWNVWTPKKLKSHFDRMAMKATLLPATDNGKYFFEFEQRNFKGFLAGSPDKGKYYAEVFPDSTPSNVISIYFRISDVHSETDHEDIFNLLSLLNIEKISNQHMDFTVKTPVD